MGIGGVEAKRFVEVGQCGGDIAQVVQRDGQIAVLGAVPGRKRKRAFEGCARHLELAQFQRRATDVRMGLLEVAARGDRARSIVEGFRETPEPMKFVGAIVVGRGIGGIERDRLGIARKTSVDFLGAAEGGCEGDVGGRVIGNHGHISFVSRRRVVESAQRKQRIRAAQQRLRMVGFARKQRIAGRQRVGIAASALQGGRQIGLSRNVIWVGRDRPDQHLCGAGVACGVHQEHAEEVERGGVVGPLAQNLFIGGFGFGHPAVLMEGDGLLQGHAVRSHEQKPGDKKKTPAPRYRRAGVSA